MSTIGAAIILTCEPDLRPGRLRMFSSALDHAGYRVVVIGRGDALLGQPGRVGDIAVETVPAGNGSASESGSMLDFVGRLSSRVEGKLARTRHGRAVLAMWRGRQVAPTDSAAFAHKVDALSAELILAMDPTALEIGRDAALRARARGASVRLAYDRSRAPAPGSEAQRCEVIALDDVDLGTAASLGLAHDDRWPDALRDRVPAVYSAPLDLAASERHSASLKKTLKGTQRPRVGLFLASQPSDRQVSMLDSLVGQLAEGQPVIFASQIELDAIVRTRSWCALDGSLQRAPDEDDLPTIMTHLDIVVCPSAWAADLPPTPVAVASVARGAELVASRAVVEELGTGHGIEVVSAEAVAEAIYRAAAVIASPAGAAATPRSTHSRFGYARQLATFREQLGAQTDTKLGIGPRNGNGQAWAWAQAVRDRRPALPVEVFAAQYATGPLAMSHESDISITLADWKCREWQLWWGHRIRAQYSHLLIEQGLTACGWLNGKFFFDELPPLLRSGLNVGLVFRGSEIRDPAAHASREPWSPFADPDDPLTAKLQAHVEMPRRKLAEFDVPTFVTTLDLLDDVPDATWLPQVLDVEEWSPGPRILERSRPVVLHAPSRNESMKGSHWVDDACQPLHEAGVIDYRRLRGVPFAEMPARIREADIVIDQLALGSYGVLALQAMASERLVIGHVSERVRKRLNEPIPVHQAEPPDLRSALEEVLASSDWARAFASSGRSYVCRYHAGDESAERLLHHLVDG